MSTGDRVRVRLLFVDDGSYHHQDVDIPADALDGHARLIDCLREDERVQKSVFVDVERLCSAWVVEE